MKRIILISVLFLAATIFVYAQNQINLPAYRGYVNDFANVINDEDEQNISLLAKELDEKTTAQLAVVTVNTTKPLTIEQYAVELFEKWGIGTKSKDNGILILAAVEDRTVRIETGYGLEGAIPDAVASQIINQILIPRFKQNQISAGLVSGSAAIAQLIAKEYNVQLSNVYASSESDTVDLRLVLFILFLIIILLRFYPWFLFYNIGYKGRHYRAGGGFGSSTGGGFGGGFGGFGGGFSGGGGASGRW